MIITISGQSGTYKQEVSKELAKKLNFKHFSATEARKKMAEERNITIANLNKIGETQDFTDKKIDETTSSFSKKQKNLVVDGKLSYYFVPDSIKIYLKANIRARAERSYNKERDKEKYRDIGDAIAFLLEREKSDIKRFENFYKINPLNELQYDLVIDNSQLTPEETLEKIITFLNNEKIITA